MAVGNRDDKWTPDPVVAAIGGNSVPIIIPGWIREITVTAIPGGGGTAKVQHTTNTPEEVEDDPASCQWVDWDAGDVAAATSRSSNGSVTAVRIQAAVAAAELQVCGNRLK